MEKEQENILLDKIEQKMTALADKAKAGMISEGAFKTGIEELTGKINSIDNTNTVNELKSALDSLNKDFQTLKESRVEKKTMVEDVQEAIKLLVNNIENGKAHERVAIKTVGDMLTSTNVAGTGAQPQRLTTLGEIRLPVPLAFQLCNVFNVTEGIITDVSQTGEEGGAAATAEGDPKTQYDFNITGAQYATTYVNSYVTVTRNMLKNFGYLENFITQRLMKKVMDKVSSYVFEGSGSAPVWKGINQTGFHTDWAAGGYATSLAKPTLLQALIIGVGQCRTAYHEPNGILMNPADRAHLLIDIIEKQINLPQLLINNGELFVDGVQVYATGHVTSDKFYIGDWSKSNVAIQSGFEMYVDPYTGLKNNKITLLGEILGIHYVQATDIGAFISGDISDAIAALTSS